MTNSLEEFKRYLKEVFEEDYDPSDFRHLNMAAVFEAGFDCGWDNFGGRRTVWSTNG